jgi:hypothetical protein
MLIASQSAAGLTASATTATPTIVALGCVLATAATEVLSTTLISTLTASTVTLEARDRVLAFVIGANTRDAMVTTLSVAGLAASACLAAVTAMSDQDLRANGELPTVNGGLRELKTRAGICKGRQIVLENLCLQIELVTKPINELKGEILIIDGTTDGIEIISDGLQLARIVGDG